MSFRIHRAIGPAALALALVASLPATAAPHPDPARKKVAILIFDNVQVIDYSGPLEVLGDAGFDVFTVAATKAPVRTHLGDAVKLTPKYSFDDAPQADLIVIPGGGFEAAKDSATVAWIRRESANAEHVMSVCNGAFTLANTGLLDGLTATTTAGNITRFRRAYPQIKVSTDQRVVDNGKFVATAGLSAGIDGALHMVDVMKGPGAGRSVAQSIELDWRPDNPLLRGKMADQLIPWVPSVLNELHEGKSVDYRIDGDNDHWRTTVWYSTKQAPAEFAAKLRSGFQTAYGRDGARWIPATVKMDAASPMLTNIRLEDRDGSKWKGKLEVEPVDGDATQVAIHIDVDRITGPRRVEGAAKPSRAASAKS